MTFTPWVRKLSYPLTFVTVLLTAAAAPQQAENYESWGVATACRTLILAPMSTTGRAESLPHRRHSTGINELAWPPGALLPAAVAVRNARARVSAMYGTYGASPTYRPDEFQT